MRAFSARPYTLSIYAHLVNIAQSRAGGASRLPGVPVAAKLQRGRRSRRTAETDQKRESSLPTPDAPPRSSQPNRRVRITPNAEIGSKHTHWVAIRPKRKESKCGTKCRDPPISRPLNGASPSRVRLLSGRSSHYYMSKSRNGPGAFLTR